MIGYCVQIYFTITVKVIPYYVIQARNRAFIIYFVLNRDKNYEKLPCITLFSIKVPNIILIYGYFPMLFINLGWTEIC